MTGNAGPTAAGLAARLGDLTLVDERRLARRLERLRDHRGTGRELHDIAGQVARAEQRIAGRRAAVPLLTYPPDLPVAARVGDLAAAIRDNQVVIVAGETGSGKSTQLPKVCLSVGRGVRGMIGHTQPRRIAARALAERIAEETGTDMGGAIGYTIRFGDHTGPNTLVKLMTDGILLAETRHDPLLLGYDTIIIDEAHERSLNIDFLLGYLTNLLPQRLELKVIITSATIDPGRFAAHFTSRGTSAPVVEVSGRSYPVQIRYRPYGPDAASGTDPDTDADSEVDTDPDTDPEAVARVARGSDGVIARVTPGPTPTPDQAQAICAAVDELAHAGDGDILVFLSGEREITDTAEALRAHLASRPLPTEVLPLFGRLSIAEQHRVFSPHTGRRIVLATNVAETSLTVPGIRYVIDPGTARISRYSSRTKVQRLPIEPISRASAGQRAGRCGRVADGICIRLYSEQDFDGRPEFTDPEISRTSLASVILQMASLDLGDIASFPFVDPPDRRQITDGITVLTELGALDRTAPGDRVLLTDVGRSLAALPVDPRLARMIVEADRRGCLAEILVIVAALAIQDVRQYPLEERDRAVAQHSRFVDPTSDFLALLNLWHYLREQGRARSGNAFRRMCREEYLHYLRIREWQDLHGQLRQVARRLGMAVDASVAGPSEPSGAGSGPRTGAGHGPRARAGHGPRARAGHGQLAGAAHGPPAGAAQGPLDARKRGSASVAVDSEAVHTALLAGLASHIGQRLEPGKEYQGTRGSKFMIWPGSALARSGPALVVAAELVETSRLWGRLVAKVDAAWVERVAGDLLRRSYSEPRWDAGRGAVLATEKVTLLGVTLVAARTVQYDRIDPAVARQLFIRHALVEGEWSSRHPFLAANQASVERLGELEDKARRRDIVLDDEALFALYDGAIPVDVTSGRHLDSWWRKASRTDPGVLTFTPELLLAAGAKLVDDGEFPDSYRSGGVDLDLDYVFEPGRSDDGVSVTIPLAVLARVDPAAFEAQIPGLRADLAIALIRSLPKQLRRAFVPAPDFAAAALAGMPADSADALPAALATALTAMTGIVVRAADFDVGKVPTHLRMTFKIVDDDGREVAAGKDLPALQDALRSDTRDAVAKVSGALEVSGLTGFPADGLAPVVTGQVEGTEVSGYPALVDEGGTVGIRVYASKPDQARAMRAGTRRLLATAAAPSLAALRSGLREQLTKPRPAAPGARPALSREQLLMLATAPHGSLAALLDDATAAAVDALLDWAGYPAWDADSFAAMAGRIGPALPAAVTDILTATATCLQAGAQAAAAIDATAGHATVGASAGGTSTTAAAGEALAGQLDDMRAELADLLRPGFVTAVGAAHLPDVARYLRALGVRAERLREGPDRDRDRMIEIRALSAEVEDVLSRLRPERRADPDAAALRRMLAEYRVALFAQPMRTAFPVSPKRIRTAIAALPAGV